MTVTIDDLREVSNDFTFVDTLFSSEGQPEFGVICEAQFALSEYSRTGASSGEWISVRVNDNSIEVAYKTEGTSGNSDDKISLPADATKDEIKQAIREHM